MSPAIHEDDTVKKISAMTRGICFLARFCEWKQPFRDALSKKIGIEPVSRMTDAKEDCENVTDLVREAGFAPRIKLVEYNWADKRTPEEMADYLYRHDWREIEGRDELKAKAKEAAEEMSLDGYINDDVNTLVAWIYWKTR